jgi:medium-chain acyl-[acyl-carrier-protein] hydrolase
MFMVNKASVPWIVHSKPHPRLRLFCFPYAGGGASIFRLWSKDLPEEVEVCPIYLPGRENRFLEPGFTDVHTLALALTDELLPYTDIPFALFGHSMGGLICYVWACHMRKLHGRTPTHIFLSAQRAPQLPPSHAPIHELPDAAFLDELFRLGGTPAAVMQNKELMELMLPLLRADFTLYETYTYTPDEPFECPISAYYGEQDHLVSAEALAAWREHTRGPFTLTGIPGNHFFLQSSQDLLLQAISLDFVKLLAV